jgi:excisionase family DNA binding protein
MALFLTPREVAARWGCSARHVQELAQAGRLQAMRLGRRGWRIPVAAVEAYEAGHTTACESAQAAPTTAPASAPEVRSELPSVGRLALPDRWWENPTLSAVSSAAGRGRSTGKRTARQSR